MNEKRIYLPVSLILCTSYRSGNFQLYIIDMSNMSPILQMEGGDIMVSKDDLLKVSSFNKEKDLFSLLLGIINYDKSVIYSGNFLATY